MPSTLRDEKVVETLRQARRLRQVAVALPDQAAAPQPLPKPFPSPADWRDQWIYFLMLDRFNNPAAPPRSAWDHDADGRQGGTLEGVRQQLGYIQQLGAGAIWLTPVLKNRQAPADGSYHGYGIQDFLEVDPRFGSGPGRAEAELEALVDEAHARGLYVILDIVINHAGDVFAYDMPAGEWDAAPWSETTYSIEWRDAQGEPEADLPTLPAAAELPPDAVVWPREFQRNEWFRRQGKAADVLHGDFESLKEFRTEYTDEFGDKPVWNILIRAYQYIVARYDIDGFRVDTLKHVEREFALTFCNAIREFALSIGKKNFLIYGESRSDDESVLAAYTGRFTTDGDEKVGADAALDFPLQWRLDQVAKGFQGPEVLHQLFDMRKQVLAQEGVLSTHGDASRFYVTFLDCHDDSSRFLNPVDGRDWSDQLTMALGCLFSLQGIPCVYYGTEQGLKGTAELYQGNADSRPEHVREALWGKPDAFSSETPIYDALRRLAEVRAAEPALRYGRQYFR
ncbi:MAG TPA: alpha-amylase family glycosyl hydrolase, partial [Longimicrobiales bacterium]